LGSFFFGKGRRAEDAATQNAGSAMSLPLNCRLGPYEIRSQLGSGGMGEVYRARDSRLNRDVAIKVLREDDAADADYRSRFEREARAVAALNHPNIVGVYDFGLEAGRQFIVSELIEGQSLRSMLIGKPLPVRKLLDIAIQVADGLSAAHAARITHRDLKPENIMLAKDGRAKILDFGLARHGSAILFPAEGENAEETMASERMVTEHLTADGALLGTAGYMSPEQAAGKEADYRSDQFSFGLVLHEMASGKQAFARATTVETMAAIIRDEPPIIQGNLPAPLRWLIDRCLQKEVELRYESTRDLFRDLCNLRDHLSEASTSGVAVSVAVQAKKRRWKIPAMCAACFVLGALAAYLLKPFRQNIGAYRYTPFATDATGGVWSPDGKAAAYASTVNGRQTYLRYLNSPTPVQLTHEQQPVRPIGWSKDQSHIIVAEDVDRVSHRLNLYSVASVGGELEFIMSADCEACDLSRDGNAFATLARGKDDSYGVQISNPFGSPLVSYTPAPFASKDIYDNPQLQFSPDGKQIVLIRNANNNNKQEGWLLPFPFAGRSPQAVLANLSNQADTPSFGWMADNRHIVVAMSNEANVPDHLWVADIRSNDLIPLTNGTTFTRFPRVAPDGKRLLLTQSNYSLDVVALSVLDGSTRTLINTGHHESMASWAAKAEKLVWVTNRSGQWEMWVRSPDGSDRPVTTAGDSPNARFMTPSLSPSGDRIIFAKSDDSGMIRLWISSLSGGSPIRLTNVEAGSEFGGAWSPDGGRFSYIKSEGGKEWLMLARTSGGARPVTLKQSKSFLPDWSPSGDWITYKDDKGWNLASPEGKPSRFLGNLETPAFVFSKDGKLLYGILTSDPKTGRQGATLFSLNVETLERKVIKELGDGFSPASNFIPGIRFSLAPDGKSFVYSTAKSKRDIWMLQGFSEPGWLN
jgi:eukaryotic-like serine/threonine-protein kinase